MGLAYKGYDIVLNVHGKYRIVRPVSGRRSAEIISDNIDLLDDAKRYIDSQVPDDLSDRPLKMETK